ncbi:indolepyruvate ferredoxin oxidoreductase family protein [Maritimibacter sp. HL-12]|uniref:indolepyruvate ferredoxin oxidoreductase family protein n=1 Tax=Maritimibacter sp. HL-12 TaxID=1162418 RepID=UPI000A0F0806|nr:indolepyruvate ferredoxin oxidoreductase family protein [Maritimibacter sp. HL-12]SMH57689.1 indolepyruvate ferredoxin oxidoreductase [Maritimibacter sp. HL-12]
MTKQRPSLEDRFDLAASPVLITGTQALVRLVLMQKARDRAAGLNTAGYVTGYRGSPLGALDAWMMRQRAALEAADIRFEPALNEDLAATALWGSQQAGLRGEGRFDGVFGLWYGKGPGVDRSGDVMRHVNMAGTSPHGGVLMAMGDDHTGESSTVVHASDWAAIDAGMPVLSPAGVQEVLDYGLYGWALSRFAGLWVGLKLIKDTVESTAVVDGRVDRMGFVTPDVAMPEGGLNIRLVDDRVPQEPRLHAHKIPAAEAFARANRIDRRMLGKPGAKIGFVAAGKSWLDLAHALELLGIGAAEAERLGVTAYKVGQVWPLDRESFAEWAEGLELIVCVEEKRKVIEGQVKDLLFGTPGLRVLGARDGAGAELFPAHGVLDPVMIGEKIGALLEAESRETEAIAAARARLAESRRADNGAALAARLPYFCAGCPHNTSTKVPEGSRAYAGIGCHYLVQFMDRETEGFTQMGGEGANWIGEAPFSSRPHVFVNIGDGTYNHSGIMAIRAAIAAGVNATYKILYNDAVAMTGGQANDGGLDPQKVAAEMVAAGAARVVLVHDPKEEIDLSAFPRDVARRPRDELDVVQKELREINGVTVLLYLQTCAAEKRRRRKRGAFPDPDTRVFINPDICEGCGDCGVQSNCVAIVPVETELGRKRAVDQSACNKDFSCLNGFCPSFVTVEGGKPRGEASAEIALPEMPEPEFPAFSGTWNTIITGVGGTGVVTIGAVLAQAAHIEGKGAALIDMTGIAQKGGAVTVHLRIAARPEEITAIRVATGEADALIGGDLVVSASPATLALLQTGRSGAVVDGHEKITGAFTRDPEFRIPAKGLGLALEARLKDRLRLFDASELARTLLGDSIYSNMMVLGAAWQTGLVPVGRAAIFDAIRLNGQAVEANRRAFDLGRWAVLHPGEAARHIGGQVVEEPRTLAERIAFREAHLVAYQGEKLARRYRALVDAAPEVLREAVALGYHKALAYKDEYEVARLMQETRAQAAAAFEGDLELTYHMAPPLLSRPGPDGRPKKRAFGPWIRPVMAGLARLRALRGTPFDPFGHATERRMERALIRQYEADMAEVFARLTPETEAAARELARLPLTIRGFGPVKAANAAAAARRRAELLDTLRTGSDAVARAAE